MDKNRSYDVRKGHCDQGLRETVLLSVTAHDYIIDIVHHRNVLINKIITFIRCTYSGGGDYHYLKGGEALNVHSLYVHDYSHLPIDQYTNDALALSGSVRI